MVNIVSVHGWNSRYLCSAKDSQNRVSNEKVSFNTLRLDRHVDGKGSR